MGKGRNAALNYEEAVVRCLCAGYNLTYLEGMRITGEEKNRELIKTAWYLKLLPIVCVLDIMEKSE